MAKTMSASKTKSTVSKPVQAAKPKPTHPRYQDMLIESIGKQVGSSRSGVSRPLILKYILGNFDVNQNENVVKNHIKLALKKCVEDGSVVKIKNSFKFPSKAQQAANKKEKAAALAEQEDSEDEPEEPVVKKIKTPIKKKSTTTTKSPAPKKATTKKTPTKSAPKAAPKKSPAPKAKKAPAKKTK